MRWAGRLRIAARVSAVAVVVVAAGMLALQAAGLLPITQTASFGPLQMAPSTATALALGGVALWLRMSRARRAAVAADALAVAMSAVVVAGMWSRRFGVMRPAYNTLAALLLLAGGLLLIDRGRARRWPVFQWLAIAGGSVALLAAAGYVYGSPHLYRAIERTWGMAAPTAAAAIALAAGILCARPERGLMSSLTLDDVRGRTLRRVLPALFAVPLFAFALNLLARSEARWLPTVAALLAAAGVLFGVWLAALFSNVLAREAAAQERLRQVVDSSSDPIVDTDRDGIVRSWNRAAARVYGYAAAEVVGRPVTLVVPPEARDGLRAMLDEVVRSRRSHTYEGLRQRSDGSTFFAETTLSPIIEASGEVDGIVAVLRDLTARKTAEEALEREHKSEQRRREALERVNVATDVVSVALAELPRAPLPVLLQVFVEQAVEAVRCDHAAIDERDGGGPVAERGTRPEPEAAVTLEVPIAWRDQRLGTLRLARRRAAGEFADEERVIAKMLAARTAAAIEISRTYAREARERAWLASAIDQIPDPVVLVDADGRIKHVNPAALQLTRTARGGAEGSASELVFELERPTGETIALDESPMMRALRRREVVRGEEIRVGEGEGAVPMLVTAAPVVDASGSLLGAAMVARDISAAKALDRLREEWTSVVAHDLRQPVSVIHLTAQRLMTLVPAENGEHDLLVRIVRAVQRLNRMIADLLDMSQLEAHRLTLTKKPVDLKEVVGETVRDLADVAAPHPIVLRMPEASLPVDVDSARIAQIVGNLVTNAVKYSAPDSEIVVELRRVGDGVEVAVSNHGRGIPAGELDQLFGRFRRSSTTRKSDIPGLGLGLFICKGLVEAHGGRIWAESVPDQITTFRFTLPLAMSLPRAADPGA